MRHDASDQVHAVGDLVVVSGRTGVWRVERLVFSTGTADVIAYRCFAYTDGAIEVIAANNLTRCPDNTPAA